jgi:hypothetical protein
VVGGQPFPSGGLGGGQLFAGEPGLLAVDREELGGGLKSGQVRQALVWGQSCCGGRPQ